MIRIGVRTCRVVAVLVALLLVVATGAACARSIAGTPSQSLDTDQVAGLPVTDGPSGLKPGVPDTPLRAENATDSDIDRTAINAVADVDDFWKARFPIDFNATFTPVGRLLSYDSNGRPIQVCGGDTGGLVNAFYCPPDDVIAWDRGVLLPQLQQQFGQMAIVLVLAHELGHAVQTRLNLVDQATPTIVSEQQADCFAGAFMRHVAEGGAPHFRLSTGNGLSKVMASVFSLRDQIGTTATKKGAHGTAFDRVTAFQFGFTDGPKRCAAIDEKEVASRQTENAFPDGDSNEGNLPITQQTLTQIEHTLATAFQQADPNPPKTAFVSQPCDDATATPPASYCPATDTISLDLDQLAEVGTPRNQREADSGVGDFAAFGLYASRFVLAVQKSKGLPLDDHNAGLRTACLVGAWTGELSKQPGLPGSADGGNAINTSPGDLDEAVAELLSNGLIAADVNGRSVKSSFARVEALRIGFLQGTGPCTQQFG